MGPPPNMKTYLEVDFQSIEFARPIGINVSNQLWLRVCSIVNVVGPGSLNVMEDPFGFLPMNIMGLLHVSLYNVNDITFIRSIMCQVQQATNQLLIDSAVHGRCAFSFFKDDP